MVTLMNQLQVLRYLNIYDHKSMANQLSSEDKSKRSVIRIIFYNNTYENEGKLYIDGECDTSLAEMDSLLNHKQMFLKFY